MKTKIIYNIETSNENFYDWNLPKRVKSLTYFYFSRVLTIQDLEITRVLCRSPGLLSRVYTVHCTLYSIVHIIRGCVS